MKDNIFPILSECENELININGYSSFANEITCKDLSQLPNFEIEQILSGIEKSLSMLDSNEIIKFYRLKGRSFLNTVQSKIELLNLKQSASTDLLEVFFNNKDIYSDIGIYDDYISFNGTYRRILSVKAFGTEEVDHSFIPEDLDYILIFKRKDHEKALKKLDRVRISHRASLFKQKRDLQSEGAYEQAEELIEDLTHENESIFSMEMYILVDALSLEALNLKTMDIIQFLKIRGIDLYIEGHSFRKLKSGLSKVFTSLVPGVIESDLLRHIPNKTSHLARLICVSKSKLMHDGIEFYDTNDSEIYFNPFSLEFKNKNMLVTGSSGGGKSVFVNKLVHSLIVDHPTVILDKGGSFKKLCLYHNGVDLDFGINPMHFRDPIYLREFILSVVDLDKFDKLSRGLLLSKITEHLEQNQSSVFFELIEFLEADFPKLSLYFEDIKEFIKNDDLLTSSILYVDIENFPKTQIAPLIIYTLEYFKNLTAKEKILVFDEAWEFLKDHSSYIDECFRTFRKSGAFPIAISQGIDDFKNCGDLYSSISNNSYFKVYFPQNIIDDVNTTSFDNDQIDSLGFDKGNYSECYLKTQDNKYRKNIRIYLSPLEKELFHTESNKSEKLFSFYNDHRNYFDSNKETIESFVRLHHETI